MWMNICLLISALIVERKDLFIKDPIWDSPLCFTSIFPLNTGQWLAQLWHVWLVRQDWFQKKMKAMDDKGTLYSRKSCQHMKITNIKNPLGFVKRFESNSSSQIWHKNPCSISYPPSHLGPPGLKYDNQSHENICTFTFSWWLETSHSKYHLPKWFGFSKNSSNFICDENLVWIPFTFKADSYFAPITLII